MLNLLWSGLNLLLFAGLLYILFRAARLVRQHMGWGALLFFVFALLVLGGRSPDNSSLAPKNLLTNIPVNAPLGNTNTTQSIPLGGSNTLTLLAEYRSGDGSIVPRGLFATVSGIMLGHRWEPTVGILEQRGTQVYYQAVLNHQWRLLGTPVYTSNGEVFEGVMKPNRPLAQR